MASRALLRRRFLSTLIAALAVHHAISTAAVAGAEQDAAAAMVREFRLGQKFPVMVLTAASQTQTFKTFMLEAGPAKARQIFTSHMDAVIPKYQSEWDRNLADAYAEHFTVREMRSIVQEKQASPYVKALQKRQRDVGVSMQRRSTELLSKVTTEVLAGAYAEVTAKK
jgi:hypothetical protein